MLFLTLTLFAVCLVGFPIVGATLILLASQALSRGVDLLLGCGQEHWS